MSLCPVTDEMIGSDMWCYSCDEQHKKSEPTKKQKERDYLIYLIGVNIMYGFFLYFGG